MKTKIDIEKLIALTVGYVRDDGLRLSIKAGNDELSKCNVSDGGNDVWEAIEDKLFFILYIDSPSMKTPHFISVNCTSGCDYVDQTSDNVNGVLTLISDIVKHARI